MTLSIGMYSFDTTDAAALAGFWWKVTGKPVDAGATADYATLAFEIGPTWMFVRTAEPALGNNPFMLDLAADPCDDEVKRVRASRARSSSGPTRTMARDGRCSATQTATRFGSSPRPF